MHHANNFNLLRLFAAAQVVFMHSYALLHLPTPSWLFNALAQFPGVPVFFVISGFLVTESCLRSSLPSFFHKRALRIYPALAVNILTLEFLIFITGGLTILSWRFFPLYLPAYTFTASDWVASKIAGSSVQYGLSFFPEHPSGVLWTLTVELSFYLALPAVLWLPRFRSPIIMGLAVASFVAAQRSTVELYQALPLYGKTLLPYFWIFAIGILARLHWTKVKPLFEGTFLIWIALDAAFVLAIGPSWLEYMMAPDALVSLRILLMACCVLSAAFTAPTLTAALRLDRNDVSYGLYLWHMLGVTTLLGFGYSRSAWLWPAVYGAGLAMATLSWFAIERPALKLKMRPSSPALRSAPVGSSRGVS